MRKFNKKIVVSVLVFTFIFSPAFAVPVRAQWIDISTMAKDYGLDALAFQIVNTIIKRITASTVNWINGGFNGKPAYVTDPEAYFLDIGDKVAGDFILRNEKMNFLCGPIAAKIRLTLARNYVGLGDEQWRCTLTEVGRNMEDFMYDFNNGGWDSFFEVTQRQQNNPIGVYMMAEGEMMQRIANKVNTATQELNQGSGFLSFKQCSQWADATTQAENGGKPICIAEKTVTPGSVISDKLNSTLGQSEGRLVMADEINEMISALISQLTEKLMGAATKGLGGLSNPDSTGGGSYTNQLSTDDSSTDYFGNAPDTSVLDVPVQAPNQNQGCNPATDPTCQSCNPATDPTCPNP